MALNVAEGLSPFNIYLHLTPREYVGAIQVANFNSRAELADSLNQYIKESNLDANSICFIVTGSDGKSERHAKSNTELTILTNNPGYKPISMHFSQWLENNFNNQPVERMFDVNPTTHLPDARVVGETHLSLAGDESVLSYAYGDRKRVYPERFLNAKWICGNEDILQTAKLQVLTESTNSPYGKRIRSELKKQLRSYRQVLDRRQGEGVFHHNIAFTLNPPEQYYSEERDSYTVGFKIPALRSIQRGLDILTIEAIMNGQLTANYAVTLPTDTVSRIESLRQKGLIPLFSANNAGDIVDSYEWFLQQYHAVQKVYHKVHRPVRLAFPKQDFLKNQQIILSFLKDLQTLKR